MHRLLSYSVLSLFGAGLLSVASAEDWPGFRGPGSAGIASTSIPLEWSKDKNVAWKVTIPGVAWSSPIVWGDKVFVTTAVTENQRKPSAGGGGMGRPGGGGVPPRKEGGGGGQPPGKGGAGGYGRNPQPPNQTYRWVVLCLDKNTGKELWKQTALEAKPRIPTHGSNTYASETPVCDDERIYVYFGMMGVFCYDLAGKELWKKDLGVFPMQMGWGTASSPVLDGDKLYLQIDNEKQSFLVALDKKTGNEVWKVDREEKTNWGSPIIWKNSQRSELVTLGARKVRSYDPATGKVLWEMNNGNGRVCFTPVAHGDTLYVGSSPGMGGGGGMRGGPPKEGAKDDDQPPAGGRGGMGGGSGGGLYAIKAGASGEISVKPGESGPGVLWSVARGGLEMASPVVHEGYLYVFARNGGVVTCLDAKTGKQQYRERLPGAKSFWASPWASGGKVYGLDDGGTTFVLQAGPEFKVLSKNTLDEMFWASSAISDGSVFLRSVDHLYCIK
ncbi:MAG: PQQ-binding-like beta-propeller repeat protein [Gemmatales bacterium]